MFMCINLLSISQIDATLSLRVLVANGSVVNNVVVLGATITVRFFFPPPFSDPRPPHTPP